MEYLKVHNLQYSYTTKEIKWAQDEATTKEAATKVLGLPKTQAAYLCSISFKTKTQAFLSSPFTIENRPPPKLPSVPFL